MKPNIDNYFLSRNKMAANKKITENDFSYEIQ